MARETAPLSLRLEEPCLCSVTYYDGEYREREVDAEAQKTVRGDYPDTEHVRFRTLPAVTFASATFRGPYDKIRAANAAVAAWVRDNGYAFDGPAFNIYHVNPSETGGVRHRSVLPGEKAGITFHAHRTCHETMQRLRRMK